ncbi:hypothetical protein PR048_022514 [Dryococelus australis]|uniref:Uncharacterized protein n=1 Tax=Dryococelus australis TaxID=614101 RepID=A0ABQ9H1A6_9NEOP|nr:hypothetical protein PR048_022514 [Dryococelus australis]
MQSWVTRPFVPRTPATRASKMASLADIIPGCPWPTTARLRNSHPLQFTVSSVATTTCYDTLSQPMGCQLYEPDVNQTSNTFCGSIYPQRLTTASKKRAANLPPPGQSSCKDAVTPLAHHTKEKGRLQKGMAVQSSNWSKYRLIAGQYQLGSPLVDDRPIINAVKYRVVPGMVWTNRTMVSSNTNTNRTGVLAEVDIGDSLLICLKCHLKSPVCPALELRYRLFEILAFPKKVIKRAPTVLIYEKNIHFRRGLLSALKKSRSVEIPSKSINTLESVHAEQRLHEDASWCFKGKGIFKIDFLELLSSVVFKVLKISSENGFSKAPYLEMLATLVQPYSKGLALNLATGSPPNKITRSSLKVPQSRALSGDGALDVRGSVAFIDPPLLGLKRREKAPGEHEFFQTNKQKSFTYSPDFRMWESRRTMPLVGGFSRGSLISRALSFRRCSKLTSITLIGSQDLVARSSPNLFFINFSFQVLQKRVFLVWPWEASWEQGVAVLTHSHSILNITEAKRWLILRTPPTHATVRPLASHRGEPGSIPGRFSHVGIMPDDATDRRVYSGISRFPRPFIPALLHTHLTSPSPALKTSTLRAVKISSIIRFHSAYFPTWVFKLQKGGLHLQYIASPYLPNQSQYRPPIISGGNKLMTSDLRTMGPKAVTSEGHVHQSAFCVRGHIPEATRLEGSACMVLDLRCRMVTAESSIGTRSTTRTLRSSRRRGDNALIARASVTLIAPAFPSQKRRKTMQAGGALKQTKGSSGILATDGAQYQDLSNEVGGHSRQTLSPIYSKANFYTAALMLVSCELCVSWLRLRCVSVFRSFAAVPLTQAMPIKD